MQEATFEVAAVLAAHTFDLGDGLFGYDAVAGAVPGPATGSPESGTGACRQ